MPTHAASPKPLLQSAMADHQAGRLVPAEAGYRRALSLDAGSADAHYNLAIVLQSTHRLAEAEAHYRRAIALRPENARAWNNLGNLLRDTRRWDDAVQAFGRAIELQPDHRHARMNLALALLSSGRYAQAWPLYESRLAAHAGILPKLACPRWRGESLTGRRLLLVCEQGFGDAVQFVRYAPLLRERGVAQLSVLCRGPLAPLLATCEGVDRIVEADDGSHDLHVPLLSLPLHCGTTLQDIPARQPYLGALPARVDRWRATLPPAGRLVGLAWRGNAGHANDARRSLRLDQLAPLWGVPGAAFVSLQKGATEEAAGQPLVAAGAQLEDFGDLAALVHLVDVVVTVDTAVAHVAGAMGKPCWVLLPAVGCDWRWFGAPRPWQAPWYPQAMHLVHQPPGGDWAPAVHALPVQLLEFLSRGARA